MQQMQVFITAKLLYMFRTSIEPIIRSTSNCPNKATLEVGRCPDTMTCTRNCSYSLMCS